MYKRYFAAGTSYAKRQNWREAVDLLWPNHSGARFSRRPLGRGGQRNRQEWWVLPSAARPRLLVPTTSAAAWTMLHRNDLGARSAAVQTAAAWLLRSGCAKALPLDRLLVDRETGVEDELARVLGKPVQIGIRLARTRADRVLVIEAFGGAGESEAFGKLGTTAISDARLAKEAANLRRIETLHLTSLRVPRLIHQGEWEGHQLVVITALHGPSARGETDPPLTAMKQLMTAFGTHHESLGSSAFMTNLLRAVDKVSDSAPRPILDQAWQALRTHGADVTTGFGSWHGDWVPWNMSRNGGDVALWDWEHFEESVPWGFDVLHFHAQQLRRTHRRDIGEGERQWLSDAPRLLSDMGVDRSAVPLTIASYLLSINVRYLVERHSDAIRPVRVGWGLRLLEDMTGSLPDKEAILRRRDE
jgi:hypothetical protein